MAMPLSAAAATQDRARGVTAAPLPGWMHMRNQMNTFRLEVKLYERFMHDMCNPISWFYSLCSQTRIEIEQPN